MSEQVNQSNQSTNNQQSQRRSQPKVLKLLSLELEDKEHGIYRAYYSTPYHANEQFLAFVRQKCIDSYSARSNGLVPEVNQYYSCFGDGEYINYISDIKVYNF